MEGLYNSVCITSVAPAVLTAAGIKHEKTEKENKILLDLKNKKIGNEDTDRVIIYNPDAVAFWIFGKYTNLFSEAFLCSDIAVPMLSVMPSVTPVCFASMYTGVMPEVHGIRKYTKPVLKQNTIFDEYIKAGKKCAIVSTEGDSISRIFLEREMDYFIYETEEEVNKKAFELIKEDKYDLIVIYNGDYDGNMHKVSPEGKEALDALKRNIATYSEIVKSVKENWKSHNVLYGFCPDHGCHEIDGGCGAHGLDMEEDMNVIHFYGVKKRDE